MLGNLGAAKALPVSGRVLGSVREHAELKVKPCRFFFPMSASSLGFQVLQKKLTVSPLANSLRPPWQGTWNSLLGLLSVYRSGHLPLQPFWRPAQRRSLVFLCGRTHNLLRGNFWCSSSHVVLMTMPKYCHSWKADSSKNWTKPKLLFQSFWNILVKVLLFFLNFSHLFLLCF